MEHIQEIGVIRKRMKVMDEKLESRVEDTNASTVQKIDTRIHALEEKGQPTLISRNVTEIQEMEHRKCTHILFNVEESKSEDPETCRTHDIMQVNEVCEELKEEVEIER